VSEGVGYCTDFPVPRDPDCEEEEDEVWGEIA